MDKDLILVARIALPLAALKLEVIREFLELFIVARIALPLAASEKAVERFFVRRPFVVPGFQFFCGFRSSARWRTSVAVGSGRWVVKVFLSFSMSIMRTSFVLHSGCCLAKS